MPKKEIAAFTVPYLQVLDEQGRLDEELAPPLTDEELVALYRHMVWGRKTDERMLKLQRQGRIGTFAPATGQEAAHVAAMFAAEERDWFVGAFREHGARLMRGESLRRQLLYYNGFEEGNVNEPDGNPRNLPVSVIVAAQALHAVGIAYAMRMQGEPETAVVCFMGDGATSQGDFHEALNFASVWQLPVVFVVQNNQWAISVPREKQTRARTLAQKAIAYEMPGIQVDGNDALAVYAAVREALERGRRGEGPTLVEAVTYRLMMHTTADDQYKYRSKEEEQAWWEKDPLRRFRLLLEGRGLWDDARQQALEEEIKAEIDRQVAAFEATGELDVTVPFDHVYGTPHPRIERQKAEFLAEMEKEGADA